MILYQSTRGDKRFYKFSRVILKGIADDGGLFVPTEIPKITSSKLKSLLGKSYQEICLFVCGLFRTDFPHDFLEKIIRIAYSSNFDNKQIAPLVHLKNNQYILELWHGPTSAFKDMALQIMPYFFAYAVKVDNQERVERRERPLKYLILVATSGDTGKAALEGYRDKQGMSLIVFYPSGHVSELQELQMVTQEGDNVAVYGMSGDFDDVQRSVKEVFTDREFSQKLNDEHNTVLSSANSINWGRLLPQVIYYVGSYIDLVNQEQISLGDQIDVAVPTGNFGNILAAFYARQMGLPLRKLICASNANNVVAKFLRTGDYDVSDRTLINTPSPSMDILIASNIERLLYELTKDKDKVLDWMRQLVENKRFTVDYQTRNQLKQIFFADWITNEDCLKTIKKVYNRKKYLMDPHTAVVQAVADRYQSKNGSETPLIVCSTAHWAKFAKDVHQALIGQVSEEDEFATIEKILQLVPNATIPQNIRSLRGQKVLYNYRREVGKEAVEKIIYHYIRQIQ